MVYFVDMVPLHQIETVAARLAEAAGAERVILFGSYARGQAHDDSDVDLMFVAPSDLPRFKRSRALYCLLRPYPFPMDLVVYTPEEVERSKKSPLSFVSTVLREGKTLYVRGTKPRPAVGGKSNQ
ncbi:MAG: nucleotidyltransferase domain-containing protein [Planctomycetes bacterium]|nr:nucleotidyltransferase domain-containing protein [Planctomycetota bacterium]MCG2684374.1 nucleotidyltransferase domain-containing protein [Planctomycetales bacterium]